MNMASGRAFSLPRPQGSHPDGEDAYGFDELRGRFVISDGAGSAFASRAWARTLVRRFIDDPGPMLEPAGTSLSSWHSHAVDDWRAGLNVKTDRLRRAAAIGSAATLLGVHISYSPHTDPSGQRHLGPACETRWHAAAIGDSCLYLVREGRPEVSFPIALGQPFPVAPDLLHTNQVIDPVSISGTLTPGDTLLLATDALSRWASSGPPSIWPWLTVADPGELAAVLGESRSRGDIDDDDLTLLTVTLSRPA